MGFGETISDLKSLFVDALVLLAIYFVTHFYLFSISYTLKKIIENQSKKSEDT